VNSHNGLTFDPEPTDLDKFESVYKAKKVVDMVETNQLAAAGWLKIFWTITVIGGISTYSLYLQ
jgi:hypothetical protein